MRRVADLYESYFRPLSLCIYENCEIILIHQPDIVQPLSKYTYKYMEMKI